MATSCSDESCGAPKDFHLSSIEGSENRFSATHQKCLLCFNFRKVFYCKQCIKNGDFVHSASHLSERFAEKQLRMIRVKVKCKDVEGRCEAILGKRFTKESILIEINRCKEKVNLLKLAIQQKRDNIKSDADALFALKNYNDQMLVELPKYKDNIERVSRYVQSKKVEHEHRGVHIEAKQDALKKLRRQRLKQLVGYVFPIREIPNLQSMRYGVQVCRERALAEASRPMRGSDGAPGLASLQVLSAFLPLDGDYTAYCHWVSSNKGLVNSTGNNPTNVEPVTQNPAYRISAALAYSAQLLRITAFYLDVRLPFNISYNDLCSSELEERKFKRFVWRLQSCASVLLEAAGMTKGSPKNMEIEPPLHTLLRASPMQLDSIQDEDVFMDNSEYTFEEEEKPSRGIWWGGDDAEGILFGASDDDESEPPEHLHWDLEILGELGQPPTQPRGSQATLSGVGAVTGGGLITSAAASFVSMWRGWTAK